LKVVCTADTHGKHEYLDVPDGDIFIFAGDLSDLPHKYKIFIDGNHDFAPEKIRKCITNGTYLTHNLLEIGNLKIWGTSWSYWMSNQIELKKNNHDLMIFWQKIPEKVDILITHFPPYKIGDLTNSGKNLGNRNLSYALKNIKPKYHVFGHVHEAYGIYKEKIDDFDITCINCSAISGFGIELKPSIVFTV